MSSNSLIRDAFQQLIDTFDGGNIDSLLFTSFNFSASFFENNVLPLAAGCSIKDAGSITAAQLNEALAKTEITVVCDRSTFPEPKSNYRYGQLAVGLKGAFFHPKIILATGTLKNGESAAELIVGSCNLTLSGWGLNREVAGTCKVGKQQADNLLPLIQWLSKKAKDEVDYLNTEDDDVNEEGNIRQNLKSIETFLTNERRKNIDSSPKLILRLPSAKTSKTYLDLLTSGVSQPVTSCRIVSPFWSNREKLEPLLDTLFEKKGSKNVTFVPSVNHEGSYCFPSDMRDFIKESCFGYEGFANDDRYTHAKYVSLITKNATHCFIGSANFTQAAMGRLDQGNVEAMLHYQIKGAAPTDIGFITLNESDMNWADDLEAEEKAPEASPYVTYASYNWKTQYFNCVLQCSEKAYKRIVVKGPRFNCKNLEFKKQADGTYLASLKLSVRQPVYLIEIPFVDHDNNELCVYQGLVAQWNAEEDELVYSPKPQLSKING